MSCVLLVCCWFVQYKVDYHPLLSSARGRHPSCVLCGIYELWEFFLFIFGRARPKEPSDESAQPPSKIFPMSFCFYGEGNPRRSIAVIRLKRRRLGRGATRALPFTMSMRGGKNMPRYDSASNLIQKSVSNLTQTRGGLGQIVEVILIPCPSHNYINTENFGENALLLCKLRLPLRPPPRASSGISVEASLSLSHSHSHILTFSLSLSPPFPNPRRRQKNPRHGNRRSPRRCRTRP
jgi:hypothetical protein